MARRHAWFHGNAARPYGVATAPAWPLTPASSFRFAPDPEPDPLDPALSGCYSERAVTFSSWETLVALDGDFAVLPALATGRE